MEDTFIQIPAAMWAKFGRWNRIKANLLQVS